MIEKLTEWERRTVSYHNKINELVDAMNNMERLHNMPFEKHPHKDKVNDLSKFALTSYGRQRAKLEMLRACLDDLEEEIRQGSI